MMQAGIRRVVPRVASLSINAPLAAQPVRFFNKVARHEGRHKDVGNRRDWNDDFTNWNLLGRWDPFATFGNLGLLKDDRDLAAMNTWKPRSSITETKEGDVLITAEMPGLSKEDIQVDLKDGVLTIKGSKKEETTDESSGNVTKHKRSFHRSFSLPEDIDPTAIKAKMEHGVLEVTIPKPKEVEQKSTSIAIQ